jgi:predicted nucleotidyltransferase
MDEYIMGCRVTGTVVVNDWEGDPDVVRGVNYLEPYLQDVVIEAVDLAEDEGIDDYMQDEIEETLLQRALEEA